MGHEANVNRWYFSDQSGKDQIMVKILDRLDELEQYKAENELRKGVPSQLKVMGMRTKPPNNIA